MRFVQPMNMFSNLFDASCRFGEKVAALQRGVVSAFVPPSLQQPVAVLLVNLPASICDLNATAIASLPSAFKREVCPLGSWFAPSKAPLQSWTLTLAEVVFGAAAGNSSQAAGTVGADAWISQMCR